MKQQQSIWTMSCLDCKQTLPQALKNKYLLETMKVNCSNCCANCEVDYNGVRNCGHGWLAKNAIIKETTVEEWLGPNYKGETETPVTMEEFQKFYEQEIKDDKITFDDDIQKKE